MSKLSEPLKALINASHARPNTIKAPSNIASIYTSIATSAASKNVGLPAWLTLTTAATMTLNSPQSLLQLHALASQRATQQTPSQPHLDPLHLAEFIREVGLKCISFNGIPRTINMLGALHSGLPASIQSKLSTTPTRNLTSSTADQIVNRGNALWKSIYTPFEDKLIDKLAQSHPNLPVYIVEGHYGLNLSDPEPNVPSGVPVGRILTSIVAIACLRAQTGVGPQVLSHVFGLRKAFEDGSAEGEDVVPGGKWLASDEGSTWLLEQIDQVVEGLRAEGAGFADAREEKLKAKL